MSRFIGLYALTACTVLLVYPAWAQETAKPPVNPNQTAVSLSASDQKDVQQDTLVASLRIEMDDKDARKVQDAINKAMQKALETTKAYPKIKASTGQYYVYQYDPNPSPKPLSHAEMMKRMMWKGSQTFDIQSKDAAAVLEVAGKMQDMGFVMNGLNYMLSTEAQETHKDELLVGALQKIQKKADLIAKSLGKTGYDIVEVNVDGVDMPSQPPMMMKAMRAEMAGAADMAVAAPVAAPGETTVTLTVSAKVLLK